MIRLALILAISLAAVPTTSTAQHSGHGLQTATPSEAGQSAFAAMAEIVALLQSDPETDWDRVDLEALRQHLIDMDRVILGSIVSSTNVADGARFVVTGATEHVIASIQRMAQAHVATMEGTSTWNMTVELTASGAIVVATDPSQADAAMIRGLGFGGILAMGTHHPTHHLAIARGTSPHGH